MGNCTLKINGQTWAILKAWFCLCLWATFNHRAVMGGCPKVCECKWRDGKETVVCASAGFIDIPRGLDPSTQVLDLRRNNLQILPRDAFIDTGLVNLQKLWLTQCKLKQLEKGAFSKLANLVELDLSDNLLRAIPSLALADIPGLRELRMAKNQLSAILSNALAPIQDLVRLDLSYNKIEILDDRVFLGLTRLEVLKLSGNKLVTLDVEILLPLVGLHGLHLDANPWHCDCNLRRLRQWMTERNVASSVPPTCNQPVRLGGQPWQLLQLDEFVCIPQVTAVAARVLAAHGDNVSLACRVDTDIDAAVTWLVGDRPLPNDNEAWRYRVMELVGTNHSTRLSNLTIAGAASGDQGIYRCIAENKAGRTETNLTLQVSHEIIEVPLVAIDHTYITGGLLGGIMFLFVIMLLLCVVVCRKGLHKHKNRRRQMAAEKFHNKTVAEPGMIEETSFKLGDYHTVPTNDLEEGSSLNTRQDQWIIRDSTSVDDFGPTKELENGSSIYSGGGVADAAIIHRNSEHRPAATGAQYNTTTVSFVEIPKSSMAIERESLDERVAWKATAYERMGSHLPRDVGQVESLSSVGSGGKYPDLLDLPHPLHEIEHSYNPEGGPGLLTLNPAFCTIPRRPRRTSADNQLCPDGRERYGETVFSTDAQESNKSFSAVDLSGFPVGFLSPGIHTSVRRHPSLPGTPILEPNQSNLLQDLIAAHRAKYLAEVDAAGGALDPAGALRYEYHASQLEKFLQEYKSLQEQLYRMKENCETLTLGGAAPVIRHEYKSEVPIPTHIPYPELFPLPLYPSVSSYREIDRRLMPTEPLKSILKKNDAKYTRSTSLEVEGQRNLSFEVDPRSNLTYDNIPSSYDKFDS